MAFVLTSEAFTDLMRMCLTWEWENAVDSARASHNREHRLYPTQIGWTTVDKIVRILHGLEIITKKQKSVIYKDKRLQHLVLRNCVVVDAGERVMQNILDDAKKDFALQCAIAETINREKMLRNMRFYITRQGQIAAQSIFVKYASVVTRATYSAEIKRQDELLPNQRAKIRVMTNYRHKVSEETKKEK